MTTIKNLASALTFNEEAQVMAIKSNMPRDIYGLCMQYQKLDELKMFLIELFENPRMKSAMPSITAGVETSAFSMGEFVNNDVVSATPCLLYTSPSPRDATLSRMPSSA